MYMKKKFLLLSFFDEIRKEFRNEKLFMVFILINTFMRKEITLEKGYDTSIEPFIEIQVTEPNMEQALTIFSDNKTTLEEEFLITNLFFIPTMQRFFMSKEIRFFTNSKKVKALTPNFCTLTNPTNYKLPPGEDFTKITVYQEDGLYKIKLGHVGKAKAKYTFHLEKSWECFMKMWDVIVEEDFDKKVAKFDDLQIELIKIKK